MTYLEDVIGIEYGVMCVCGHGKDEHSLAGRRACCHVFEADESCEHNCECRNFIELPDPLTVIEAERDDEPDTTALAEQRGAEKTAQWLKGVYSDDEINAAIAALDQLHAMTVSGALDMHASPALNVARDVLRRLTRREGEIAGTVAQ